MESNEITIINDFNDRLEDLVVIDLIGQKDFTEIVSRLTIGEIINLLNETNQILSIAIDIDFVCRCRPVIARPSLSSIIWRCF